MRWLIYFVLAVLLMFIALTLTGIVDLYREECNDSKTMMEYYDSALKVEDIKSACSYSDIRQEDVWFSEYLDIDESLSNIQLSFIKTFLGKDGGVTVSILEYDSAEHAEDNYLLWLNSTKENLGDNNATLFEEKNDVGDRSFDVVYESFEDFRRDTGVYPLINVGGSTIHFVKKNKMVKIESQESVISNETGYEIKPSICNIGQLKSLARVLVERIE